MFQPEVKLEFVRRYCSPTDGWTVFVDIDASEEGRTGSKRTTVKALRVQRKMQADSERVRHDFQTLGVKVGGKRTAWFDLHTLPHIEGDRDIVAFHKGKKICLIAEAEGASSGQPEQKLYKAIGQLVMAASAGELTGWTRILVLVVHGEKIAKHLSRASALEKLAIVTVSLGESRTDDNWMLASALLSKLLSGGLRAPPAAPLVEAGRA